MKSVPLPEPGALTRILESLRFAAVAHAEVGQLRQYTGEPYIVHPMDVVLLLSTITSDPDLLEAAGGHDVDEDTNRRVARSGMSAPAQQLVAEVTDPEMPEGLTRAQKLVLKREHLAKASPRGQTLKCADGAANLGTGDKALARLDPKRAASYVAEWILLLEVLPQADPRMRRITQDRIEENLAVLAQLGIRPKFPKVQP